MIRWFLKIILLTLNAIFPPRRLKRNAEAQTQVDKQTSTMRLYQFAGCPFCIKVRRAMVRLGLTIETYEVKGSEEHEAALIAGGGKRKVPCLRIDESDGQSTWLYDSSAIVSYLNERFAEQTPTAA